MLTRLRAPSRKPTSTAGRFPCFPANYAVFPARSPIPVTPSKPRTLVRTLLNSGVIACTLTATVAFAEAAGAETSDFASAGPAWVSPVLPAGVSGSTAAWDNTLAGVYELALRNDPVLARERLIKEAPRIH